MTVEQLTRDAHAKREIRELIEHRAVRDHEWKRNYHLILYVQDYGNATIFSGHGLPEDARIANVAVADRENPQMQGKPLLKVNVKGDLVDE